MTTIRLRPTFVLPTVGSPEETLERIRAAVADRPDDLNGRFVDRHAMISYVELKRHFWSPWLQLEIRQDGPANEVFGRFSPHPSIWTAFMFAYLSLGVASFFSAIAGWSQQLAGESPWAFYVIPLCAVLALVLWIASCTGQKLAHNEMDELKQLVTDCLEGPTTKKSDGKPHRPE